MIEYRQGDMFAEDLEALVNPVNCVGVMGLGLALQFKQRFPAMFQAYRVACRRGEVQPGQMHVFETDGEHPRWIVNYPTKRHYRQPSRMDDVEAGLLALVEEIRNRGIRSIAIPPLGCGSGGLRWDEVRPRIEAAVEGLAGVRVVIFEPHG